MASVALLGVVVVACAGGAESLSARYPDDVGIENDPTVLFADNFEGRNLKKWDDVHGSIVVTNSRPHGGKYCVEIEMVRGKNTGGDAKKWFMPGHDKVYVRFYAKFSADYQYNHHFVWLGANQRTNKWSAFGKAGLKPDGTYYSTGMEPWFDWGEKPAARRGEPLHLLPRHGERPEDGQILGQRFLSARTRQGTGRRPGPGNPSAGPMAMLGVHDSSEYGARPGGRAASDVGGRQAGGRVQRNTMAQGHRLKGELPMAGALWLRSR